MEQDGVGPSLPEKVLRTRMSNENIVPRSSTSVQKINNDFNNVDNNIFDKKERFRMVKEEAERKTKER